MAAEEEESLSCCVSLSITFRRLIPTDFEEIRALHDLLFPVKYSDSFYVESCEGRGIGGRPLYSCVAVDTNNTDRIIGFILAQFMDLDKIDEKYLVSSDSIATDLCYILTIGVRPEFAKLGIASQLLSGCVQFAKTNRLCAAIYLHVIDYNSAAISFYEKNNFSYFKELADFYLINGEFFASFVYVQYVNGFDGPLLFRLWRSIQWEQINRWLLSIWSFETRSDVISTEASRETTAAAITRSADASADTTDVVAGVAAGVAEADSVTADRHSSALLRKCKVSYVNSPTDCIGGNQCNQGVPASVLFVDEELLS